MASRLDDAARAGWLYYVAGRTQDEIAAAMGISRQSAQRLVSLAVSERLVKVRLDHPIAQCLELAERLKDRYGLGLCEIVPSDPLNYSATAGIAEAGAVEIGNWLRSGDPIVMAIGTGRTLKSAVDQLPKMSCPQHKIVSLTGNIGPDGSAAYYNVIFSMAEQVQARHFPMLLPVYVSSPQEREVLHQQPMIRAAMELARDADVYFVGIGHVGTEAPLFLDGFVDLDEMQRLVQGGAVGEICGWLYDDEGHLLEGGTNARVASMPIKSESGAPIIALAMGRHKHPAIRAALRSGLVNGVITDESAARFALGL
jgi:DNA-binding transcriptional regulator LsrR (DeoR family)